MPSQLKIVSNDLDNLRPRQQNHFLIRLYRAVSDYTTDSAMQWAPGDTGFVMVNKTKFKNEVLRSHFGSMNYITFLKHMSMYNFGLFYVNKKGLRQQMGYRHEYFVRDQPILLEKISRK